MSKMHRRRRSRDGLSFLLLLLLFQNHQFDERVGVGKPDNSGHGAAAEPLCEGQLATMGWQGDPDSEIDAQVQLLAWLASHRKIWIYGDYSSKIWWNLSIHKISSIMVCSSFGPDQRESTKKGRIGASRRARARLRREMIEDALRAENNNNNRLQVWTSVRETEIF